MGYFLPEKYQKEPTLPTPQFQTSDLLMRDERIILCDSKPPTLWSFVMAAIEN